LSNPEVVRARTVPVKVRAMMTVIIFVLPSFWSVFKVALPATSEVLSINKSYVLTNHLYTSTTQKYITPTTNLTSRFSKNP
jgi:hypothetical protein